MSDMTLQVRNLVISVRERAGRRQIVSGLDFDIHPGEIVGLAGESGCGKSVTAKALMGLLPRHQFTVDTDRLRLADHNLSRLSPGGWRQLRGRNMAMVFQDPVTALDPVFTVGYQVSFAAGRSLKRGPRPARALALESLGAVGFSNPRDVYRRYPHELSGGMRQLCMLAMAVAVRPALLLADEPTTALDVTTQARVLSLLRDLRSNSGAGMLLISHDLGVLSQCADRVLVMQDGRIVEQARTAEMFANPRHPYTAELVAAIPRLGAGGSRTPVVNDASKNVLVDVKNVCVGFRAGRRWRDRRSIRLAVEDISLQIRPGQAFGLAGESGSGKSTLARTILGLLQPVSGEVRFDGEPLAELGDRRKEMQRRVQIVFQDPGSALSPRRTVAQTLLEPLRHFRIGATTGHRQAMIDALEAVGLDATALDRYPHQFSSGQRQRIAIARALLPEPDILVADEAVSALDVPVQARILELLKRLRQERGIALLFISHDLAVVRQVADTVGVMYRGRLVELAPASALFTAPMHPYTRQLLRSTPDPDRRLAAPETGVALASQLPAAGCPYRLYCQEAMQVCKDLSPRIVEVPNHGIHRVECHLHDPSTRS